MVAKRGLVGALVAIGAAMLFVVSAAAGVLGGHDVTDMAPAGSLAAEGGLDGVLSSSPEVVADGALEGYVLDNSTGEGIAGALVLVIHIPENMTREQAHKYVDRIIERLRCAREKLDDRRQKLEMTEDLDRQKLERAQERLEDAEGRLEEKRERLRDKIEDAKERPGGAGRPEMKRAEQAARKMAAEEEKLEQARERLGRVSEKAKERLEAMKEGLREDAGAIRDKLAAHGIFAVRTDPSGHFETKSVKGMTVIVALAPGYGPGRLGVELPLKEDKAVTLRLDAKPRPEVYRLRFVWGYLDELNPEGRFAAWNGSITASDGAVRLVRAVQFEHGGKFINGGDDRVYRQKEKDTLSWRSSTTVARDGVVVDIAVPAGSGGAKVTLTAGEWSQTAALERLEGQKMRIPVGDAGHEILVACELLGQPAM